MKSKRLALVLLLKKTVSVFFGWHQILVDMIIQHSGIACYDAKCQFPRRCTHTQKKGSVK